MNAGVLAHHETFQLGPVEVRPATKTVAREGRETVVEPRVMQVLVALADAKGAVVSRDDLVEHCWDGRIVGDDAVNRIMSRLRHLAVEVGQGSFVIETVTKVGYRLRLLDRTAPAPQPSGSIDRRKLVIGLAAGAGAVAIGALTLRPDTPSVSRRSKALFDQAMIASNQYTREGASQAEGILRQLVIDQPDYADAWGALGLVYVSALHLRPASERAVLEQRARAAGNRALALDRNNGLGLAVVASARPVFGNWLALETTMRAVLDRDKRDKRDTSVMRMLSSVMFATGRTQDSLQWILRSSAGAMPTPGLIHARALGYWYAGRLDDADAVLGKGMEMYPTHFALWFRRLYTMLYSGRAETALAMIQDRSRWPSNIPAEDIQHLHHVAEAVIDPTRNRIDAVMATAFAKARAGSGYAVNYVQIAGVLGRPQAAFAILHAYYFGEGFQVPEVQFTASQGTYTPIDDRLTGFLFAPSMTALHREPAFAALTRRIGLADYWRRSGTRLSKLGVPID